MVLRGHRRERSGERFETGVPSNAFIDVVVRNGNGVKGREALQFSVVRECDRCVGFSFKPRARIA